MAPAPDEGGVGRLVRCRRDRGDEGVGGVAAGRESQRQAGEKESADEIFHGMVKRRGFRWWLTDSYDAGSGMDHSVTLESLCNAAARLAELH